MIKDNLYRVSLSVVKTLQSHGFQTYFAGGCVRDMLMKRKPKDYDVATNAQPNDVIKLFDRTLAIGKAFGVVMVLINGHEVEVTTFRTEGKYTDGRHPDKVKFARRDDDVSRRDFTINGLLYDPMHKELVDLVGGQADIKAKIIRAIGEPERRFREDKLRMMRAIRFACELGFAIDPATKKAIAALSSQINKISKERIREELRRILISPLRAEGIKLMDETGLLKEILPEMVRYPL